MALVKKAQIAHLEPDQELDKLCQSMSNTSKYINVRQICQNTTKYFKIPMSNNQNTSKYIKIRQNTSKYIKIRQNISKHDEIKQKIILSEKKTT